MPYSLGAFVNPNVLLSSAGRRVALLQAWRHDLRHLGLDAEILTADASRLSAAARFADRSLLVPRCTTDEFVPTMLELCRRHQVGVVVPTIDTELPTYAAARGDFAAGGTAVLVSSPEVVRISGDKVETHRWLVEAGLPTVRQATLEEYRANTREWPFPLVVKPRWGSASIGVAVAADAAQLEGAATSTDVVVQSLAPGREYTVDALVNGGGEVVCTVARLRLEVRAGEVSKAVTARCGPVLEVARMACEQLPGAYGPLTLQVFFDDSSGALNVIELNARFGGGYPLAWQAGARYPQWILEELAGRAAPADREWRDGLVMLRYDEAAFADAGALGL